MTIKKILKNYSQKLIKTSSSPELDIELLLSKILKKDKEYFYSYPEKKITTLQLADFKKLFQRRKKGEPIAYILGYKEFYGLKFKVNKNVLIPRPESEILVDKVIKFCSKLKKTIIIADIGVGSGSIIISLAKNIKNAKFYGTDISAKALQVANYNAQKHKVKIKFFKGNLIAPVQPLINNSQSELIITANLPYLDHNQENILISSDTKGLKFEPQIAWDGGIDGLDYYQQFFQQINDFSIKPTAIFLEIGHTQFSSIKKMAKQALPSFHGRISKDLCGFDRLITLLSPQNSAKQQ